MRGLPLNASPGTVNTQGRKAEPRDKQSPAHEAQSPWRAGTRCEQQQREP